MKCQITIADMRPDDCSSEFSRSITPLICYRCFQAKDGLQDARQDGLLHAVIFFMSTMSFRASFGMPKSSFWLKDALHSFSRPSTCFPKRGGMHRALLSTSRSGAIAFHTKKCVPRSERNGVHFARVAISRFGPIAFSHTETCSAQRA